VNCRRHASALASVGLLRPRLAAFIHVTSELAFVLNSARLSPRAKPSAVAPERPSALEGKLLSKAAWH